MTLKAASAIPLAMLVVAVTSVGGWFAFRRGAGPDAEAGRAWLDGFATLITSPGLLGPRGPGALALFPGLGAWPTAGCQVEWRKADGLGPVIVSQGRELARLKSDPCDQVPSLALSRDRKLILQYRDAGGLIFLRFALNFVEERLEFDVSNGVYCRDDGSVLAAERARDSQRLFRDYWLNGIVQIWDADTRDLLSRLDAFIPLNCFVNLEGCNRGIAEAEAEITHRMTLRS